ncbi:alpha/beta hydrolase [Alteraurantiacibacter aestuarii]|uniref:Alpha/beta fold hydrolase n=1 Tax=Alteraurantiacibacter aestuarii TaxID=650004 RepID=A0A844ZJU0_9SPHN|nr:alpha/beta fold hydrolase [Alteraurantiacibacter aestuarii]
MFLGGRADFFEKYLEPVQTWSAAGWQVSGFDWRGQGGSGQTHADGCCHMPDFGLFLSDLEGFAAQWMERSSGPHVVIGHSMGAHVVLRAVAERRIQPDGIILSSPMLGIRAGPLGQRTIGLAGQLGRVPMLSSKPVWGKKTPTPRQHITTCPDRHADKLWWKAKQPELARGGPTWGWLAGAVASLEACERQLRRRPMVLPCMMLCARSDLVVDNRAINRLAACLPRLSRHEIFGAGHELLRERDRPRGEAMALIARFCEEIRS